MILDLQMARMAIAEYFMTYDSPPRKFEDAHMPAPPHARLLENGSIEYRAGGRPTAFTTNKTIRTALGNHQQWDAALATPAERTPAGIESQLVRPD